jgi:hypothetical protein
MLVGLKSLVISRNLRLYGIKFGKLSASVEDFSYLISYNHVDPLQLASEHGLACYCSHGYLKQNCVQKRVLKLKSVPVVISFMPTKDSRWLI